MLYSVNKSKKNISVTSRCSAAENGLNLKKTITHEMYKQHRDDMGVPCITPSTQDFDHSTYCMQYLPEVYSVPFTNTNIHKTARVWFSSYLPTNRRISSFLNYPYLPSFACDSKF